MVNFLLEKTVPKMSFSYIQFNYSYPNINPMAFYKDIMHYLNKTISKYMFVVVI